MKTLSRHTFSMNLAQWSVMLKPNSTKPVDGIYLFSIPIATRFIVNPGFDFISQLSFYDPTHVINQPQQLYVPLN